MYSEDTWVFSGWFYVLWHSLSTVVLSSPKNFLCGKLDDSRLCLLCGKIALCYFVEKSLGGYCSTFICNGLHTYALSIFGSFVKMSVLFNFVFVCVHIVFFSNMIFFCFSVKNMRIYVQKSNSRFWSSHIAAIYIAWDFWKKSSGQEYFTFLSVTS